MKMENRPNIYFLNTELQFKKNIGKTWSYNNRQSLILNAICYFGWSQHGQWLLYGADIRRRVKYLNNNETVDLRYWERET